mmetsp:Transcript_128189/g.256010  ORF Transcript_128189/g.256010 Transcript_128189/m.256010 type:complete len:90 (+) Transcript_128189:952-1221(+)
MPKRKWRFRDSLTATSHLVCINGKGVGCTPVARRHFGLGIVTTGTTWLGESAVWQLATGPTIAVAWLSPWLAVVQAAPDPIMQALVAVL